MSGRYSDYDDLIRDLDHEGIADDSYDGKLDDDDLALLSEIAPGAPRPRPRAPSRTQSGKPPAKRRSPAKKP
jgi:hypothetical protein